MKAYARELIKKGVKNAIFDIDNTITKSNIVDFYLFIKSKHIRNKWCYYLWFGAFLFTIPGYLMLDFFNRGWFAKMFVNRFSSFSKKDLEQGAKEFFEKKLKKRFIKQVHDMVFFFRDNGVNVYLLSCTIEPIVKCYGEYFEVPYRCISVLEKDDKVKVDLSNFTNFKENFVYSFDPDCTVTIADSKHDIPILKYCRFSIIVTNNRIRNWMRGLKNSIIMKC